MKIWEYFNISVRNTNLAYQKDYNELLSSFGKDGWELISAVSDYDGKVLFFFKREKS